MQVGVPSCTELQFLATPVYEREVKSSLGELQRLDGCHPEFAGKPKGNHKSTGAGKVGIERICGCI